MKLLLVTGEYPPMEGGVGDYTRLLGEALVAFGAEVHVLTSVQAAEQCFASAVQRHALMRSWSWRPLYVTIRRLVAELKPDVVNIQYQAACYGLHPAINLLPRWLRSWAHAGTPCVTTFHDLLFPYLFPKAGPLRWWAVRALACDSSAAIVTNVQDEQRLREQACVKRLVRIPIGSNVPRVLPAGYDRAAWRKRWGVPEDAFLLCYFGFLNASKGGEELVDALERVCLTGLNAYLIFVGGAHGSSDRTNQEYWASVQRRIAARGMSQRVVATGFLPPGEVSASLCCADVCVLPYRDGASFRRGSLLAALEHGLPIVSTTPQVAVPELRDGQNVLLVPPADAAALAAAILRLSVDEALRQRLGAGARELAGKFAWEQIAARTLEVYHAVLRR